MPLCFSPSARCATKSSVPPYFLGGTEMNGGAIRAILIRFLLGLKLIEVCQRDYFPGIVHLIEMPKVLECVGVMDCQKKGGNSGCANGSCLFQLCTALTWCGAAHVGIC